MSQWFVRGKGQMYGPMTDAQLKQLADNNQIGRTTEVAQSAAGPWHAAATIEGLFPAMTPVEKPRVRAPVAAPPQRPKAGGRDRPTGSGDRPSDDGRGERNESGRDADTGSTRVEPPADRGSQGAPDTGGTIAALRSRFDAIRGGHFSPPTGLLDIFDWRFKKYLTPWILRITWIIVLVVAALGIGSQILLMMGTWLPEIGWGAGDDGGMGNRFPGEFERDPVLPFWLRIRFAESLVRLSVVLGVIVALLWIRVILELAIVLFNIATSLTSIERLIEQEGPQRGSSRASSGD